MTRIEKETQLQLHINTFFDNSRIARASYNVEPSAKGNRNRIDVSVHLQVSRNPCIADASFVQNRISTFFESVKEAFPKLNLDAATVTVTSLPDYGNKNAYLRLDFTL